MGVLLASARLLLVGLAAPWLLILPEGLTRRLSGCLLWAMGVRVVCNLDRDDLARLTDGCVVAANHVSVLDLLAVCGQPQACILIAQDGGLIGNISFLPLARGVGAELWRVADKTAFARRFARWRRNPGGRCLYVCPEQTIGNQRGLFRFHATLLDRGLPIVPLAARLDTPFGVRADPMMSSKAANFFRLLGLPTVRFELDYLPRMAPLQGEASADFARRVQEAIAEHLGIPATDWTPEDKRALRARLRAGRR
ncbi:hypothetical protein GVN18_43180 [Pseudomonas sp. ODNR1LW]|nr:hypothetical protein [Pseudomonas sp. ODNR1LW]